LAEHAHTHHPGSRVVRWGSIFLLLAAAAGTVAAAWPVIHDRLPLRSASTAPKAPPIPHLSPFHAQVAATGTVSGAQAMVARGATLWMLRSDGKHPVQLVRYSAHALRPVGGTISLRRADAPPLRLATGHTGVYLRSATGVQRVDGHALVDVTSSSLPRALLLSLSGAVGFDRAWTTDGHRLYERNPGSSAPTKVAIPRPVGASAESFVPASAQPVVLDGRLWVPQAVGAGKHRIAQLQPLTPAGHFGGRPVGLGRGRAVLALVSVHRLWVVVSRSPHSVLYQVNPLTGRVMRTTALPRSFAPVDGAATGRALWLAEDAARGAIVRVSLTR